MSDKNTGKTIRAALAARKMTRRELARSLGVRDSWLRRRLQGKQSWKRADLLAVLCALEIPIELIENYDCNLKALLGLEKEVADAQ